MGVGIRRSFRAVLAGSLVLGSVAVGSVVTGSLPASANTPVSLYVSTSGSDGGGSNACTASATPCLTIQQAINEAQGYPTADADDVTINVAAGTYSGARHRQCLVPRLADHCRCGVLLHTVTAPGFFGTPLPSTAAR